MVPTNKIEELLSKHSLLEKELSSGKTEKKQFAEKSKEYSDLNDIIKQAKQHISFSNKECLDINSSILFIGTINYYFEFLLLLLLLDLQLLKLNLLLIISLFECLINKAYYCLFHLQ